MNRISVLLVAVCTSFCCNAKELYVFVPTEVRATAIQEEIQQSCPSINVTVFGRGKDFQKQVAEAKPDAIISLIPVIEQSSEYQPVIKGIYAGNEHEQYVLVSIDKALDIKNLAGLKIGVVDLMGRKSMGEFINHLFQAEIKLTRVTKQEDLLPLLTFASADGIFISQRTFDELKSKSQMNLVATQLNIKVGLAGTGLANNADKDTLLKCVQSFSSSLNATLGVDKWQSK